MPFLPSPRGVALAAVVCAGSCVGVAHTSAAATSQTIRLVGRVLPRAEVVLAQLSSGLSLSRNPIFAATGFSIANLGVWGNGSKYLVSLVSQNAEQTGRTALVDPDTGAAIGYRLRYGGAKVEFVSGEARLGTGMAGASGVSAAEPLEVDFPAGASPTNGHFQDHITVVITAR